MLTISSLGLHKMAHRIGTLAYGYFGNLGSFNVMDGVSSLLFSESQSDLCIQISRSSANHFKYFEW